MSDKQSENGSNNRIDDNYINNIIEKPEPTEEELDTFSFKNAK